MVKTLLFYLKKRLKLLLALLLAAGIFAVVFYFYSTPLDPVLYALLLASFCGVVLMCVDFIFYYRRHKTLTDLTDRIASGLDGLPETGDLIERDYQNLLTALQGEKTALLSAADSRHSDMMDYYTLWAHQIKTPIAALRLLLQTEKHSDASLLLQELFQIEQYVEMVLQYLRLESSGNDLVLRRCKIAQVVRQAVKKYTVIFVHNKKVRLDFQEMEDVCLTDEKWLSFVVEQLLSNALKYTPEGTISIYMEPGLPKTLVVEDNGIGIAQEDLPRVCEKGYTGYNGRMGRKSSGLGLYLCRQMTDKLGHKLTIQSQVGKGTRVLLDLSSQELILE